jgi:hypothetical protein
VNRWFSTTRLSLSIDKKQYMQFITKNSFLVDLKITHGSKKIANICNTTFLGITVDNTISMCDIPCIFVYDCNNFSNTCMCWRNYYNHVDNTLSWKTHTDTTVPKLSSACFVITTVKPFLCPESLKTVYYSYFDSTMT